MKKRIFAFLLAFAMMVSLIPSFALAEEESAVSVATAADLAAALAAGGQVTLLNSIEVSQTLVVPADTVVTLNLAGYTVSMNHSETVTANHEMIQNNGTLTVKDSSTAQTGALVYTYSGTETDFAVSTISNELGTLIVESGTIRNASNLNNSNNFAIDSLTNGTGGTASVTILGGSVICDTFRSLRLFANSTSHSNSAVIKSGTMKGQVWLQSPNSKANLASLTIEGGSYEPAGRDGSSVYITTASSDAVSVAVSGGSFKTKIGIDNTTYVSGVITGGTFTESAMNNTNTALIAADYHFEQNEDNTYSVSLINKVAEINGIYYKSLQAAFNAAQTGDTVALVTDVELDATLTVAAGKTIVLELNGKKLSGVSSAAAASAVILNKGSLTILDSIGNGRITSEALNPDLNWGGEGEPAYPTYANNTIRNEGALTLLSGTIESTTAAGGASYAIDNYSNGVITIEDGTVVHKNGVAIRMFAGSAANENSLTINGGTVTGGARAVWIQLPSSDATVGPKATFKVTGGTLTSNDTTYNLAVYFYSFGNNAANTDIEISGGTFNGDIAFYGTTLTEDNISISGGTFNGAYGVYDYYGELADPIITGGNYQYVDTAYIAEGYDAVLVDDYYIVHQHDSATDIPAKDATCTETGLTAGKKCSVCGTVMSGVAETPNLEHSWSTDFQPGTDTHWQYCENNCGAKQNEAAHTFIEKIDNVYIVADSVNGCAVEYVKSCSVCGKGHETETFWVTKDTPEHTYDAGSVTTEPTCTAAGVKIYTCTNAHCGHTKTETVPAKAHTLQKVDAVAATYFAPGNIAYYTCTNCDKLFTDAEGTKEASLEDVTLAQLVKIEDNTADVSTDVVEDVIQEAANAGTTDIVITVTQDKLAEDNKDDATDAPETAPAPVVTKTQLPVAAVEQVAGLHEEATLTINMTNATVTMDKTTLDVVTEKAKTEQTDAIALEIEHIKTEALTPVQQVAVEEKTVAAVISASILVNDKEVHDFEGGKVTVAIPFTPEAGTAASDYIVLYIADDGTVEEIPSTIADGKLVMTLSHFSEYVVVNTAAPKDTTNPDTGDGFSPAVMLLLMAVSASAIVVLSHKKHLAK